MSSFRWFQDSYLDRDHTTLSKVEAFCGRLRKIDNAASQPWATVIDLDHNRAPVAEIGDFHFGSQRDRPVRGREFVPVESRSARRSMTLKFPPVPTRHPVLDMMVMSGAPQFRQVDRQKTGDGNAHSHNDDQQPPHGFSCLICLYTQDRARHGKRSA